MATKAGKKKEPAVTKKEGTQKIVITQCEDWQGLYVDGKLLYENHHITARDISEHCRLDIKFVDLGENEDVLEEHGYHFPELLSDLNIPQ